MLDTLFRHLPKSGDILVEPCAGSCSVALNTQYQRYLLNDANPDLIRAFKLCRDYPTELIAELRTLLADKNNNPDTYYAYRHYFNTSATKDERAILLFYFSQMAHNGVLRVNKKNEFNVPFGDGRPAYLPETEIHFFSEKMKHAEFFSMDFENFIAMCSQISGTKNLYLDPPYKESTSGKKTFTQYTCKGFYHSDHVRIDTILTSHRNDYANIFVSNHQAPDLETTYVGATKVVKFRVPRTISRDARNRVPAGEVILYY